MNSVYTERHAAGRNLSGSPCVAGRLSAAGCRNHCAPGRRAGAGQGVGLPDAGEGSVVPGLHGKVGTLNDACKRQTVPVSGRKTKPLYGTSQNASGFESSAPSASFTVIPIN